MSVLESIRNNPDKYTSLIHYDDKTFSSTVDPNLQFYNYAYGKQQEQQQYAKEYKQISMDILIEDAEKLYNKLAKELIEKIIDEYSVKSSSSATLPSLIATDQQ